MTVFEELARESDANGRGSRIAVAELLVLALMGFVAGILWAVA
jgi:hypothetical protein